MPTRKEKNVTNKTDVFHIDGTFSLNLLFWMTMGQKVLENNYLFYQQSNNLSKF